MTIQTTVIMINVCQLLPKLFPGYWDADNFLRYSWGQTSAAVIKWCDENDAHYYGKPKEDYSELEALQEAEKLGKRFVITEDLS